MSITRPLPAPAQTQDEWLQTYRPVDFAADRHSLTVDLVLLTMRDGRVTVPLIRRLDWPEYGKWVLPGGYVRAGELVAEAAQRVLQGKLVMPRDVGLSPLRFYDSVDRDVRWRTISMAFLGRVRPSLLPAQNGVEHLTATIRGDSLVDDDDDPIRLGFDHADILLDARRQARAATQANYLWPLTMLDGSAFTVPDLSAAHRGLGLTGSPDYLRRKFANDPRVSLIGETVDRGTGRRQPEAYRWRA